MAESARVFLHLTSPTSGLIKGESTVEDRENWIDLDSWNWSLDRSKRDDAIPEPSLFSFKKTMDRTTTAMLQAMIKGEQLRAKIITDDASLNLLDVSIFLEQVTIRDYSASTDISETGGFIDETWVFDYRWITFEYQADAKSGVKSIKLHRPFDAEAVNPGQTKETEFRSIGTELLEGGMSIPALSKVWEDLIKNYEKARNRPDGKSLSHATKTPKED